MKKSTLVLIATIVMVVVFLVALVLHEECSLPLGWLMIGSGVLAVGGFGGFIALFRKGK